MDPIIRTEKLTHTYGEGTPFMMTAIRGVDFEARKGEFIGIIGRTGSGKSTLIQHLNGLFAPTSGKVFFDGRDIFESKEITRAVRFKVGLVFQYPEYQLFEETVRKDIAFGPKNMGLSEAEISERVLEAAGFVKLSPELLDKSPFELSGGEKRRVAIAGVIAMMPEVLILDEPTAGLDPRGCDEILDNILSYHEATGATVIMVSHSMKEIASCVKRMVVMSGGEIVMDGTPSEIFSRAKELMEIGMSVPPVTKIALKLRELGVPVDGTVFTTEQAVEAICALKGGNRDA